MTDVSTAGASTPAKTTFNLPLPPDEVMDTPTFWSACGRGFACVCSVGGGGAVSHIGCNVSPAIAFAGVASGASVSLTAMAVSAALTGAGLAAWYKLRGAAASTLEKRLTIASALTGAAMSVGIHLFGGGGHHDTRAADAALVWYRGLPEDMQATMRDNARAMGQPLSDYVLQICSTTPGAPVLVSRPAAKTPVPGLDKP